MKATRFPRQGMFFADEARFRVALRFAVRANVRNYHQARERQMISGSECAAIPGTAGFNIPRL